jgi:hypothetical protein
VSKHPVEINIAFQGLLIIDSRRLAILTEVVHCFPQHPPPLKSMADLSKILRNRTLKEAACTYLGLYILVLVFMPTDAWTHIHIVSLCNSVLSGT